MTLSVDLKITQNFQSVGQVESQFTGFQKQQANTGLLFSKQLQRIMLINAEIGHFTKPPIVVEHQDCKLKGKKNESLSLCG
jgi:hypothetical protein